MTTIIDNIIVGAGISGLSLVGQINKKSKESCLILEKSLGVGGRLATRRAFGAKFDHGTPFLGAKEEEFGKLIARAEANGVLNSLSNCAFGKKIFTGRIGMTALAKYLISKQNSNERFEIKNDVKVKSLEIEKDSCVVRTENNGDFQCKNLYLTPPVPQTLEILDSNLSSFDPGIISKLKAVKYKKTISVLFVLDRCLDLSEFGFIVNPDSHFAADLHLNDSVAFNSDIIDLIIDNKKKGISESSSLTVYLCPDFSDKVFDLDENEIIAKVYTEFSKLFDVKIFHAQIHRWRYSEVINPTYDGAILIHKSPKIIICGDGVSGSTVEDAFISGLKAAEL